MYLQKTGPVLAKLVKISIQSSTKIISHKNYFTSTQDWSTILINKLRLIKHVNIIKKI